MAIQRDYANHANKFLFSLFSLAPLVFMPAGFALLAFLSLRYFPGTSGSGIPQTIAAIDELEPAKTGRLLSIRIIAGKIGLTLDGLLPGSSIGREGPTVQVGAAVMHFFYGKSSFRSVEKRRILILAGGAAGISSAFNTALAGIMFARDHRIQFAAACGLGVALLGLMTDSAVFGIGYDITRQTLENRSVIPGYFCLAKMLATLLSSVSGIAGGLFAPSLAAGAGLGAKLGEDIAALFPGLVENFAKGPPSAPS